MKLLTQAVERQMPPLYSTEKEDSANHKVYLKLFTPWARWTWYVAEASWADNHYIMYAYRLSGIDPLLDEWRYVSLSELKKLRGPHGLRVKRDRRFRPMTILDALRLDGARIPDFLKEAA